MSDFVDYQSRKFDPNINDPVLLWNIFVLCYFEYLEINVHAFSALLSSVRFSFCPGPRELWPFYPCPNVVVLLQIVRLPFLLIWSNFLSFSSVASGFVSGLWASELVLLRIWVHVFFLWAFTPFLSPRNLVMHGNAMQCSCSFSCGDRFFSALFSIFVCFLWIFYVNFESLKLVQIKDGASLSW